MQQNLFFGGHILFHRVEERPQSLLGSRIPQRFTGSSAIPEIATNKQPFYLIKIKHRTKGCISGTWRFTVTKTMRICTPVNRTFLIDARDWSGKAHRWGMTIGTRHASRGGNLVEKNGFKVFEHFPTGKNSFSANEMFCISYKSFRLKIMLYNTID